MIDVLEANDSDQSLTVRQAISAIDAGHTLHGLITLECAPGLRGLPLVRSYLAYCMAKERGEVKNAMSLCQDALATDPGHPAHYLNLGRVFLVAGDKPRAIAAFWRGISSKNSGPVGTSASDWPKQGRRREYDLIMDELRRLGIRKPPPFRALQRSHPLNKYTGKILARIGMR
jgi:hypothetical protein